MKLSINRDSHIPLHDQLVTQIALLIAAGAVRSGEKLPSVRALAERLGVHRNTASAVYKTLAAQGLVAIREGSGVRAIDPQHPGGAGLRAGGWQEGVALRHLAGQFISEARARGHADAAIAEAIELALHPTPITRLVAVDPHPDFHPLIRHELGRVFALPTVLTTPDALDPAGLEDAALLTSVYHLAALRAVVGADRRVIVYEVNAGTALLGQLRSLEPGTTVGLVSTSETMLRMAREVLVGFMPEEAIFSAVAEQPEGVRAVVRLADVLVADSPSFEAVRRMTAKPLHRFQLVPDASLRSLAQQLPAEAFATALLSAP